MIDHLNNDNSKQGNPVVSIGSDKPAKSTERKKLSLAEVRERLENKQGREYWRSFEELAATPEFDDMLQAEFPQQAAAWDPLKRRDFLKLMGASLALAGLTGCTKQPSEKIVPYVKPPEEVLPGEPLFYATSATIGGYAVGVLAESHMGRPTKIEGNPKHPASLGGTSAIMQASVLTMYDPDRSQFVRHNGRVSTWGAFMAALSEALQKQSIEAGAGLRLLTETVTSPTLGAQIDALLTQYPSAKWVQYDAGHRDSIREGANMAFGEMVESVYHFEKAEVVLSLDADFLEQGPGQVRYARDLMSRRKVSEHHPVMNRIYAVESSPTLVGTVADHRQAVRASDVEQVARALAHALGVQVDKADHAAIDSKMWWIEAAAEDLKKHRGSSLVLAGSHQPPVVHALAHAINASLGNVGSTVTQIASPEVKPENQAQALKQLADDMDAGKVSALIVVEANPVYNAPADLDIASKMAKVAFKARLGLYEDETSALCPWHVPAQHYLEAWSDGRAFDGAISLTQPLIEPLYSGKSAHDLLAAMTGEPGKPALDIVRDYWKSNGLADDAAWRKALHDGWVEGSTAKPKSLTAKSSVQGGVSYPDGFEINLRLDPCVGDGRDANNGWLQETPKPLLKLTWDNALLVSVRTAEELGLDNEDVVVVSVDGRSLQVPVWVTPGHADNAGTIYLGGGRTAAGQVGNGVGVNAYKLRTTEREWIACGATITKVGTKYRLAATEEHHNIAQMGAKAMERKLIRVTTLDHFKKHPDFAQHMVHEAGPDMTIYKGHDYSEGYQWGMTINLNACIGCNACITACVAENNLPVVGKEEVARGREMHWIRVDRYYKGDPHNPEVHHQPMMCQHCENATCETVCPVGATVHSTDGLNQMVYNRCVGTRYCSNNCPFKVRRFNFFQYTDLKTPQKKMMRNPDVTVRVRGVMEKCTFCVQRINHARIDAKKEGRQIADGEVVSACQQACPTNAIAFGDINDPKSEVAKSKKDALNYGLLTDINMRPRTSYLAKVRNPNPRLEKSVEGHVSSGGGHS